MSQKVPAISLIVPVYNSEKYLKEALDSVVNQTFKDFEVIVVNDGSTDNSLQIIKEFSEKYDNFSVINQENHGQGPARNEGLKKAVGEYVAFLDSDDYLAPDFFEVLYKAIKENDVDIAYCNFNLVLPNIDAKIYMPFTSRSGVYSKEKALGRLIFDVTLHHFPWNKLYKRSLFVENDLEFYNMYFEDVATCPKIFYCAKNIAVTAKALYFYRRHKKSTIALMDSEKINDFIKSFGILRNLLEKEDLYTKYKMRFKVYGLRMKFQVYFCIVYEHIFNLNFSDLNKNLKKAKISTSLFMSPRYRLTDDPPVLPFYVKTPTERRDRKNQV